MIAYIKGTIKNIYKESAVIIVNESLGYKIFMTQRDLSILKSGECFEIFCYHHINQRGQELYGFLNEDTKNFFIMLVNNVAGIGPKSALKILDKNELKDIKNAIRSGDVAKLESLGIGKKTSFRIINDLKDKIIEPEKQNIVYPQIQDAVEALQNLGYSKQEALKFINTIDIEGKSVEEIIVEALQNVKK